MNKIKFNIEDKIKYLSRYKCNSPLISIPIKEKVNRFEYLDDYGQDAYICDKYNAFIVELNSTIINSSSFYAFINKNFNKPNTVINKIKEVYLKLSS